ncbi:hypothetical protein [Ruminococcus sp. YE282]|uniref:hypothetical protein n=1 Tax=Ruminococcus sp. YE282 TaxID=3158780 RepID=UPI000884ADC5|nr:hypothetical protein SAMN02910441_00687 [Ruminococcus bromii]
MAREKPLYRLTLDRLDEKFPDKDVLSQKELAIYLGVSTKHIQRHWKKNPMINGYAKTVIASVIAG